MEDWLMNNRGRVKYNLAESGVLDYRLFELIDMCNIDVNELLNIKLEDAPTYGTDFLRKEIAGTYEGVDFKRVLVTTGTSEGLFILFNLLLERGDEVIVQFPEFQSLYELPVSLGCKVRFIRLKEEKGYAFDIEELTGLINKKTKLIIINNPHNPTGAVLPESTVRGIIDAAKENGISVIFDEHYRFLPIDEGSPIKSACEIDDYAICTGSIVKCFGLMGLRMGWITAGEDILERCRSFKDYTTHTLSPISDFLSAHALRNREFILSKNLEFIRENHRLLTDFVSENSDVISFAPPRAGVVSFIKYNFDIASDDLVKRLIENKEVFLLPGSSFETEGHFRLGYGIETEHFKEALFRISSFFKTL
jgi:aspartate/methionine/tyrosine aminotransferase